MSTKPQLKYHPGTFLREEMAERSMSISEMSDVAKIPVMELFNIVRCKSDITPEIAAKIARVFKVSPEFWINLQKQYDDSRRLK